MIYSKKGFTVVELMIAITVFAIASTLVLAGVIYIGRQYQQSSNRTAIEEVSRNVHRQVTQSIHFSDNIVGPKDLDTSGRYKQLCVGSDKYIYGATGIINKATYDASVSGNQEGLFLAKNDGCQTGEVDKTNLLPPNTRVAYLNFDTGTNTLTTIIINAPEDGGDLIEDVSGPPAVPEEAGCDYTKPGREFCSSVKFESTAIGRITN